MMRGSRARLINALRRSMIERAELRSTLGIARDAFHPAALIGRGKNHVSAKIDDAAHVARQMFRDNRLPIALASAVGLVWLFRDPIKDYVPRIGRKMQTFAASVADHFNAASGATETGEADETDDEIDLVEDDDEAVR